MSRALSHRSGMTLIELLLALSITALIAAGIASMLGTVTTGLVTKRDSRSVLVAAHAAQARLGAYAVPAQCVLASTDTSVTLWAHDEVESDTVHATEIRWIRFDETSGSIVVEFVSFPDNWSRVSKELANVEYPSATNFETVRAGFAAQNMLGTLTLVDTIASAIVTLDEAGLDARHITFRLEFNTFEGTEELDISATLRVPQEPES